MLFQAVKEGISRRRRWGGPVVSGSALMVTLLGAAQCAPPAPDARTIFLIVIDTLRPDRLSCYGYGEHETPHIDALAARGVLFERAHAVASWTVPSMGSMMTSRYPAQLGLVETPALPGQPFAWRERREQRHYAIPLRESTLAEMLGTAGFSTAAFVNQPILGLKPGWLQGFDEWFYPLADGRVVRYDQVETPRPRPGSSAIAAQSDRSLVDSFERWLPAHVGQKVFVWLHLLQPHRPYNPDREYPENESKGRRGTASERYDGEIRAADAAVGDILAIIDETVGLDESLIVVVSDHGEAFDEHGMSEHGHSLHREVTQVPLIMSSSSLPAGRRAAAHVRTIDILPTILELAGVEVPAELWLEGPAVEQGPDPILAVVQRQHDAGARHRPPVDSLATGAGKDTARGVGGLSLARRFHGCRAARFQPVVQPGRSPHPGGGTALERALPRAGGPVAADGSGARRRGLAGVRLRVRRLYQQLAPRPCAVSARGPLFLTAQGPSHTL